MGIILEPQGSVMWVYGAPGDYVLQLLIKVACLEETQK